MCVKMLSRFTPENTHCLSTPFVSFILHKLRVSAELLYRLQDVRDRMVKWTFATMPNEGSAVILEQTPKFDIL